ncbi:MAG TPA: hypothetical protein P5282_09310, partial [Anaerolineaceae bacterium]|nr:hypothetical protein [Anaerolineaceae bacterium]
SVALARQAAPSAKSTRMAPCSANQPVLAISLRFLLGLGLQAEVLPGMSVWQLTLQSYSSASVALARQAAPSAKSTRMAR